MTFSALVLGSCSRRGLLLLLPARQRRCQGCSLQTVRQWDGGTGPRGAVGSELQGQRGCVPPVGLPPGSPGQVHERRGIVAVCP